MTYKEPDNKGHFSKYGGKYIPEILIPNIENLEKLYNKVKVDKNFQLELSELLKQYSGRPTPLYFARRISQELGFKVYLKRNC